MAAIIRGRRDALAKLELEFTVGQNTPYEPHPDIESRWADLMAHMWLSEDERLSYIRELRERKAARKLEHKAKRGDSAASATLEAKKEREQAALKAAQAKAQASIDESLRNLRRRLYAYDVKGEGYVECAPARNACRGEGLSISIDGDARDRCLIKDVVKTAERAARRREQPREVECVKTVTEPLPSVADLRKAFYDADVDGTGCLPADRVQRRWRDLCGSAADPAVIAKASNARGQITLSTLEDAIAARGRRPKASAASRSVTSALIDSARRPTSKPDSSEASSAPEQAPEAPPPLPRRREIIVLRDEERDAELMRLRLLGDDAPAEPPALPDAPAFCTLRGAERDCRFFTTGVISNTSSAFVDLTSERRDDEDLIFDLRLGVAFGDLEPADLSLNCTLRYRGATMSFPPGTSRAERREVETIISEALAGLEGELAGKYYGLTTMSKEDEDQLQADHFLFQKPDPNAMIFSCGGVRDWPEGRGIFHNADKTFLVWVNEEDQMRVISMQKGGNVPEVFARWAKGVNEVEKVLQAKGKKYMYDEHLGQFSSCVSNVGTGLRASMHILLPKIIESIGQEGLEEFCWDKLDMQCRGTGGEHTAAGADGRVDISNQKRIGKSEVELVQVMTDGVCKLIELEKKAAAGEDIKGDIEAMPKLG